MSLTMGSHNLYKVMIYSLLCLHFFLLKKALVLGMTKNTIFNYLFNPLIEYLRIAPGRKNCWLNALFLEI